MYAYGVEISDLKCIASLSGLRIEANKDSGRNRVKFTLKPSDSDRDYFRKINPSPTGIWYDGINGNYNPNVNGWKWRRGQGICFHGYYRFLELLFENYPGAKVTSSWFGAIAYDRDNFHEKARELGEKRLGKDTNIYHVFRVKDTCNCESHKK